MRNEFMEELVSASTLSDDTFLVVGDLGYGVVESFENAFPERFLNSGVAEQSMVSISAGIASQGVSVFAYSIANFPTLRALEQIRNDVVAHGLPVTIVSIGAGLAYGTLGYTHHAIEDLAIMRSLSDLAIYSPADSFELKAAMARILSRKEPAYLRLGKGGEAALHTRVPTNLEQGVQVSGSVNAEWVVLSTGSIGSNVAQAINSMKPELSNQVRHYSVPVFSSLKVLTDQLKGARGIISVEEHQTVGGFGSLALEVLSDQGLKIPLTRLGTKAGMTKLVGDHRYLLSQHSLDPASIRKELETFFTDIRKIE